MPSLRQRVTTYFRQLSFIAEPREDIRITTDLSPRRNIRGDDGCFITKYLEGRIHKIPTINTEISNGKEPNDLPDLYLENYETGPETITAACTGPDEGLCGVKRSRLHLSAGPDIDFIDTNQEQDNIDDNIRRSLSISTKSSIKSCNSYKLRMHTDLNATNNNNNNNNKSVIACGAVRSRKNSRANDNNTKLEMITNTINNNNNNDNDNDNNNNSNSKHNNNNSLQDQPKKVEKGTINVIVSMISTKPAPVLGQELNNNNVMITTTQTENNNNNNNTTIVNSLNKMDTMADVVKRSMITTATTEVTTPKNNEQFSFDGPPDSIAGVSNWKLENDFAYGLSVSLYEKNFLTNEPSGSPIADCYGIVVRENVCAMALADGVNWGEGARLAARSAIQGSLEYLDTAVFGQVNGSMATSTREVFISLLRSFWEAHACILEVGGALSTLTVAVVLPLQNDDASDKYNGKYVVCSCNVGDSLGYIYSKNYGVREFTLGSHDITSMRDMRDALGALGPVDGNKPELGNLTLSMTIVEPGDIVFLTSDGISDNFDPVVGKFAEPFSIDSEIFIPPQSQHQLKKQQQQQQQQHDVKQQLAPKRQNRSTSSVINSSNHNTALTATTKSQSQQQQQQLHINTTNRHSLPISPIQPQNASKNTISTATVAAGQQPNRPPRNKKNVRISAPVSLTNPLESSIPPPSSSSSITTEPLQSSNKKPSKTVKMNNQNNKMQSFSPTITPINRPKFLRSHTVIEPRINFGQKSPTVKYPKSMSGLPLVTAQQRHALTLLRLEDLFCFGINGTLRPCTSARKLCHLLVDFAKMITSARRNILEQRELYYKTITEHNGVKREIELNVGQQRAARRRVIDSQTFTSLPGKLDHASVVAFTVGSGRINRNHINNNKCTSPILSPSNIRNSNYINNNNDNNNNNGIDELNNGDLLPETNF